MLQLHHVTNTFVTRAVEDSSKGLEAYDLPSWSIFVFIADFIIFLPILIFIDYTLKHIYPVLAIVEDENPPAYEPVALGDDSAADAEDQASVPGETVTTSIRSVGRLLRAHGGWRANLRGLACFLVQDLLTAFLMGIFAWTLGGVFSSFATLLASLCLIQYSTAWVHIVISKPSKLHFWQRLPAFSHTFRATWRPVALYWLAGEFCGWIPALVALALGFKAPAFNPSDPTVVPAVEDGSGWKAIVIFASVFFSYIFVVIPAHVVLVRVQASLLSPDVETIIPFDGTFEGKVEPAVISGRGYVSVRDAWSTFSRAAWRRLVIMYVKIAAVSFLCLLLMMAVIIPEVIIIAKHSRKIEVGDGENGDL